MMMRTILISVFSILLFFVQLPIPCDTVAVAGGLFPCVSELADLYSDLTGKAPALVVGSSGKLAGQIAAGAPFGLFVSANLEWLHFLEEKGLVGEIVVFASSPLVLWWPLYGRPDPSALHGPVRVAIVDPALGPFGFAARRYLENIGTYDTLLQAKRLIITSTALQSALAAHSGAADMAFTSMSVAKKIVADLGSPGGAVVIPGYDLIHAGAVIQDRSSAAIEAFWEYLRSEETHSVWRRWGFTLELGER
jgi:molybdate transport system substrate-binding protein